MLMARWRRMLILKQTRRGNRFLHIDGWLYQGLRSRLARHGPIGGIALRPSSFVRDGWSVELVG